MMKRATRGTPRPPPPREAVRWASHHYRGGKKLVMWCRRGWEVAEFSGEKKEMLRAIKRNNYNSERRGSWGFTGRQRTHVYKRLLWSAPDLGRLQSSGDTCCPLAFIVSNGSRLCWFIFLLVSSHIFNLLSRELHNEIRRAVNQQRSLLGWGLEGRKCGGGGVQRGIITRGLTSDWRRQVIVDRAMPSLIYWLCRLRLW